MIHRNIDDYLVDLSACIDSETIPDTFEDYLKDREIILDLQLQFYSTVDKRISRANLKKLEKVTPSEAEIYRKKLYSIIPKIRLSDLLIEVDSWTNFSQELVMILQGNRRVNKKEKLFLLLCWV